MVLKHTISVKINFCITITAGVRSPSDSGVAATVPATVPTTAGGGDAVAATEIATAASHASPPLVGVGTAGEGVILAGIRSSTCPGAC
jgi:hypothetical protein